MRVITSSDFFHPSGPHFSKEDGVLSVEEQNEFIAFIQQEDELDKYRRGEKPVAIRILTGAWKDSIFRLGEFEWENTDRSVEILTRDYPESVYSKAKTVFSVDFTSKLKWSQDAKTILVTDQGKEYKNLYYNSTCEVLLDYTGPTQVICNRKPPQKREKKVWPTTIVDDFGNVMVEGDIGLYTDKDLNELILVKFMGFDRRNTIKIYVMRNRQTWTRMLGYYSIIKVNMDETSLMMMTIVDDDQAKYKVSDFKISTPSAILKVLTDEGQAATPN